MPNIRSKKVLIPLVAAVVVIAAAGAWMSRGGASVLHKYHQKKELAAAAKPEFVTLKPFTVNLSGASEGHLLFVQIVLEVHGKATATAYKDHLPQVRNRLLLTLSDQQASTLGTDTGKEQLATQIEEVLKKPFDKGGPSGKVAKVLFTQFIVQ